MSETRTLKVVVVGSSAQAQAALRELGAASEAAGAKASASFGAFGRKMEKIGGRVRSMGSTMTHMFTLPIVAAGVASVDIATKFNASMTRIQTQAGASAKDVKILSDQVLKLAPSTQQGPLQLADALYHLKSVGMDNAHAMAALQESSNLAAVSGSDLEETTNALAGAWRSGIKGAGSFRGAIGTLNAVVGAGNMRMSDLNAAMGTGFLPAAKTFGISLKDAGGALALMTDEGIPANAAATRLRMTFSMLGAPSDKAAGAMKEIGINAVTLGETLQKPGGLVNGLQMLKDHMKGMDNAHQAAALSHMFGGGRSSSAIMTMMNNFDVLKKKIAQVHATSGKIGDAINKQLKTPQATFHKLLSNLETAGVKLGNVLLPYAVKAANGLTRLIQGFQKLSPKVQKFIGIVALVAAALGPVLMIVGSLVMVIGALMTPVGAAVAGIALLALGLVYLYKHSQQFRDICHEAFAKVAAAIGPVTDLVKGQLVPAFMSILPALKVIGGFLLGLFGDTLMGLIDGVINVVEGVIKVLSGLLNFIHGVFTGNWSQAWKGIKQIFTGLLQGIWGAIEIWWNGSIIGAFRHGIMKILEHLTGGWKGILKLFKSSEGALKGIVVKVIDIITAPYRFAWKILTKIVRAGSKELEGDFKAGVHIIDAIVKRVVDIITFPYRMAFRVAKAVVTEGWAIIKFNFKAGVAVVKDIVTNIPNMIRGAFSGAIKWLADAGKNVIQGLINGIKSEMGAISGIVNSIKDKITGGFKKAMSIFSPSREMAKLGRWVTLGIAQGIGDPQAVREVNKKVGEIAAGILKAFKDHKINAGQKDSLLEFLKSQTEAYGLAIKRVDHLTDRMDEAKSKLDAAKQKLADIRSNRHNLISSTAGSLNDYGGIMNSLGDGTAGNQNDPQSILARFRARLANIKAFGANIRALAKDGLSNSVLNQIIAAGPDEGGQMAAALLSDTSVLGALNKAQRNIAAESHAIGLQAGNRTYGAAIAAQTQIVHEKYEHYVNVKVDLHGAMADEKELAKHILKYVRDGLARDEKRNGRKDKKK